MNDLIQRYTYILKDVVKKYKKSSLKWFKNNKWIFLLFLIISYVVGMSKRNSQLVQLKGKEKKDRNYVVQYITPKRANYQKEIDTLLDKIEQALDINKPDSEVAHFNRYTSDPFYYQTPFLYPLLAKSKEVHNQTQGAFDPTVAPLVKLWKESIKAGITPEELAIWSLKPYVGLDYIVVNEQRVKKLKEEVSINLNGLIRSYQVDAIATFLKSHEIQDFCIQWGNETLVHGFGTRKKPWKIIQKIFNQQPTEKPFNIHIHLNNKATSMLENYTSQEHDTDQLNTVVIDPLTGHLATTQLIAAFVFAEDCITARAYAIAFMAKNFLTSSPIIEQLDGINFLFIYKEETGGIKFYHSSGLQVQYQEGSNKVIIQKSDNQSAVSTPTDSIKKA